MPHAHQNHIPSKDNTFLVFSSPHLKEKPCSERTCRSISEDNWIIAFDTEFVKLNLFIHHNPDTAVLSTRACKRHLLISSTSCQLLQLLPQLLPPLFGSCLLRALAQLLSSSKSICLLLLLFLLPLFEARLQRALAQGLSV